MGSDFGCSVGEYEVGWAVGGSGISCVMAGHGHEACLHDMTRGLIGHGCPCYCSTFFMMVHLIHIMFLFPTFLFHVILLILYVHLLVLLQYLYLPHNIIPCPTLALFCLERPFLRSFTHLLHHISPRSNTRQLRFVHRMPSI